ncbi:hypothetical protein GCM10007276_17860 [Agaricicola taiwanensis]|uniref:DUF2254 domain-containing protein n=1 Tax=Agaricicola taiwanensis TaxID=591372 RepID=A0A8J2VVG3_9RHOB|nr:DUF2254 domain-containing protein [Agaricicola taiwanensis]GGE40907.1 hypothetical protein GCM10007276_17860 [Agaricicola taiwanensis]
MMSRWQWLLRQMVRQIWFRTTLFSVLAVLTALIAIWSKPLIPTDMPAKIGSDAVDNILGIIASSMLAVTTFSLSTMVSAYSAATSNVTPRATKLLIEDSTTQNALATFIGSFLYSLVAIIALATGLYGAEGRVVVFIVTIGVIVVIVVMLLRWINHLSRLGRVGETTDRVEAATRAAVEDRREAPCMRARELRDEGMIPSGARAIHAEAIGYVQHIDVKALSRIAKEGRSTVYVTALPGSFADPSRPLAWVEGSESEERIDEWRTAFSIADHRSFDQDPRFGFCVLSEIASRALSPAVNDPGTAIDVIGRGVRLLALWQEPPNADDEDDVTYERVYVPRIQLADIFEDFFSPIARDGAAMMEVSLRLLKGLRTLARLGDAEMLATAQVHARLAFKRADAVLTLDEEKERLAALAQEIMSIGRGTAL